MRKTTSWDDRGYPVYDIIGYYSTWEEGNIALAEYNKEPWDIDARKTTLEELYNLWLENKFHKLKKSLQASLKAAYNHTARLKGMKYKDIKSFHMQKCVDKCERGHSTQGNIKNLFRHLDLFALEIDVINKGYHELVTVDEAPETSKLPFTDKEISLLWQHQNEPWVDSVLIFLYTGFRISELLSLKIEDIDLLEKTFKGGTKSAAGKNRIVPIHSSIERIVERLIYSGEEYLFSIDGGKISIYRYYDFWKAVMEKYNMKHTPHECRHTFRSKLDSAGANKMCIDMMMGHKSNDVGERVYTHKTIGELRAAIELMK